MLSSPRLLSLGRVRFGAVVLRLVALCWLVFGTGVYAQKLSIPGIKAPDQKEAAAKQEIPVEIRAASGQAPLAKLYDHLKVEPSKIRRLPAPAAREMKQAETGKRLQIGTVRAFPRPLKISTDAVPYRVAEGEVRVMGVRSEGALYTRVHFSGMSLPAGARVFVYSLENPDEFYGPYESRGPSEDGMFWTPPVEGDGAVIEYFSPNGTADPKDAPFQISEISHIYKDLFTKEGSENVADACNLDVTGDWAEVAKSVGYLQFTDGSGEYACTGTLLNNESNDLTPYLLTANHCLATQAEAQSLRVYWHYNSGDSPPAGTPRTDGANLLSTGNVSDFTLLRLTGSLPAGLFFAGWDASATPLSTSVTGIHHPQASHKRISFGSTVSGCGNGLPGACENFTNVRWNSGTTELGSSGSGLWRGSPSDARLVGTLTGGEAACNNPSGTDYYGSFSVTYPRIASFLQRGDNGADDNLEQNDTRSAARTIKNGTYRNLVVKGIDEDWYKVSVVAGGIVSFKINFTHSSGNIDMQLYRGSDLSPTETSQEGSDFERVISVNQTGATADYYLRVFSDPGVENNYTLTAAGAGAICSPVPINYGQTINASLSATDCQSALRIADFPSGNFFSDRYSFSAQQGQTIAITMKPKTTFNTFLIVQGITGSIVYADLPTVGNAGSVISFSAPNTGTYTIEATSFDPNVTGNYQLILGGQPETITLAQAEYIVREDEGRVAIVVNRGPNALVGATVGYATSDMSGPDECSRVSGFGSSRCDYATTVGKLRFAPGERSKTIVIPLVDDAFAEGRESLNLTLYDLTGAVYGPYQSAMIYIDDNESAAGMNPINQTPFFIRQHYIDFLGREPEAGGFQAWQDILNNCAAGDAKCDRIEVSAGFFRSPEFQERGYFIYRFYSTLGRIPNYNEFMPDFAKISGFLSEQEKEANKIAFVNEFMSRGDFESLYLSFTEPASYVGALLQTLGLPKHPNKGAWITGLSNGTMTRAQVLRSMVESAEVYHKYYNEAFVVMQYFGYLRRDPDILYLEWIRTMNQYNGDYRTMINGFMNSKEYRDRFGP